MKKGIIMLSCIVLVVLLLIFLNTNSSRNISSNKKLKIVATTTQLTDFVKNIAGNNVEVNTIFRPNVDPHEYEPTPEDVKVISDADIIIQNGVGLEKRLDKNINDSNAKKMVASDYINILQGNEEEPDGDPHIWFSVQNTKKIVQQIAVVLIQADSQNENIYNTNMNTYLLQLNDLDTYIKNRVSELPINNRKLVTNHDAFGYYIKEFGFEFIGSVIPGLSTESQPSVEETTTLINKIKEQNVKAIFTESSINPKLAEQIANEASVKIVDNLYGDTLGAQGSDGETYIKMMRYNTDNIVNNLK